MTGSDYGRDDVRAPGSVEHGPDSFAAAESAPPPYPGPPQPTHPDPGYGYPPPATPRRTGWIVAGGAALVVVLGAGVAIGVVAGQPSDQPPTATTAPGYSMNAVSNACDLVDPAPPAKWSPTPAGPPQHREVRPGVDGGGSLSCQIRYSSDDNVLHKAEILLDAEFTTGDAPPAYDSWKRGAAAKTGANTEFGPITGMGTEGYWHSDTFGNLVTNTRYVLAVLDGNVSVRVRLNVSRSHDSSQVHRAELESFAEAQVRKALNGLEQN